METSAVPVDDRETLKRFLAELHALLDRLAQDPHDLLRPELRPLVAAAWDELVAEERFERANEAIDSPQYAQGLVDHGLQGAQLEFKVETFGQFLEIVQEQEEKRVLARLRLERSVPKALEAANVTVDSVAAFIPPVAAVSEFKKAVEVGIAKRGVIKNVIGAVNPFKKRGRKRDRDEREPARAS